MNEIFKSYGDFGQIASQYDTHRLPYDESVFDDLFSGKHFNPEEGQREFRFLDVGCGTGHSTFALARTAEKFLPSGSSFKIIGVDVDPLMIKRANLNNKDTERVSFITAQIDDHLDIGRNFDMILCVSAFHWILQKSGAVEKMCSLLRGSFKNGKPEKYPFVIINREIIEPVEHRKLLKKYVAESLNVLPEDLPNIKKEYHPSATLTNQKLTRIISIQNKEVELQITPKQLVDYVTSTSLWNCIPEAQREKAYSQFLIEMTKSATGGVIKLKEWYSTTVGYRHV